MTGNPTIPLRNSHCNRALTAGTRSPRGRGQIGLSVQIITQRIMGKQPALLQDVDVVMHSEVSTAPP